MEPLEMTLEDTVEAMISADYKKRFVAEYLQTKIRYEKLCAMLKKYDAGTLDFELICPVDLLRKQASLMGQYLDVLERRAAIEEIYLPKIC